MNRAHLLPVCGTNVYKSGDPKECVTTFYKLLDQEIQRAIYENMYQWISIIWADPVTIANLLRIFER